MTTQIPTALAEEVKEQLSFITLTTMTAELKDPTWRGNYSDFYSRDMIYAQARDLREVESFEELVDCEPEYDTGATLVYKIKGHDAVKSISHLIPNATLDQLEDGITCGLATFSLDVDTLVEALEEDGIEVPEGWFEDNSFHLDEDGYLIKG